MHWAIRLRLRLLRPYSCRWNSWVRDTTAMLEWGILRSIIHRILWRYMTPERELTWLLQLGAKRISDTGEIIW